MALSIDGMDFRVEKIGLTCPMKKMNCQCLGEFIDYAVLTLKVLSSEMDPAEIRLIQQVFIKERSAVDF